MAGSPALTLYLSLAARAARSADEAVELPPPPGGAARVWLHVPDRAVLRPLAALAGRLARARPGLGIILTHAGGGAPCLDALPDGCLTLPAMPDDPALLRMALARWSPDVLVLGGGVLPPALIHEAASAGVALLMVDAGAPAIHGAWPVWPRLQRTLLRQVRHVMVRDGAARRAFRRAGAHDDQIEEIGALSAGPGALACNSAEREAMARALGVRPVWLAVAVPEAEEAAVLEAQRRAQKAAHRLLLILVPADPQRGPALAAAAQARGMQAARRAAEEEPSDHDQLYIADTEGEMGLWYRLAPITFMGGSLDPGGVPAGRDPFEPAALGSAIIHGPHTDACPEGYALIERARAARRVSGIPALAEAVADLIAPDRAALLAAAAWSVATQGAGATDRAMEAVLAALDEAAG